MKKNKILVLLVAVVVVLLVVVTVAKKKGLIGGETATKVAVEEVIKRSIVETVSASGKIQSESEVIISPDVSGEIMELPVKEGDKVREGVLDHKKEDPTQPKAAAGEGPRDGLVVKVVLDPSLKLLRDGPRQVVESHR